MNTRILFAGLAALLLAQAQALGADRRGVPAPSPRATSSPRAVAYEIPEPSPAKAEAGEHRPEDELVPLEANL